MRAILKRPHLLRAYQVALFNGRHGPKISYVHASINQRGELEQVLRKLDTVVVALVRSGHDCDCTSYIRRTKVVNPLVYGLAVWERMEQEHAEWLDGPEVSYFEPLGLNKEGHWSRDCALESYEDTGQLSHVTINSPEET